MASASPPPPAPHRAVTRRRRSWRLGLAAATVLGLAVRLAYVLVLKRHAHFGGDAFYYHEGANLLARGHGFVGPYQWVRHQVVPGADHPPLYIAALAGASALGATSTLAHQVTSCLIGAATVATVGLAGRALAGPRAGLFAAVAAAVHPALWVNDGVIMSESLVQLTVAAVLLASYWWWRQPSWRAAAAMGGACALASLTRAEMALLAPLLLVPLALRKTSLSWRRRTALLGASLGAMAVTIAPWTLYNASRFDRPVLLSNGLGPTLAAANCDATYNGRFLGYWSFPCQAGVARSTGDGSDQDVAYRRHALDYVRRHRGRLPVVMAARLGRVWGVYRPVDLLRTERVVEARELRPAELGLGLLYALAALSAVGVFLLRNRRGPPALPCLAMAATVSLAAALTYGTTRFRAPADVALVVLGSAGASMLLDARHRRQEPPAETASYRDTEEHAPRSRAPALTPTPGA